METNYQVSSQNLEKILKENQSDSSNLVLLDHQLLKGNRIQGLKKRIFKKFILSSYHPKLIHQHRELILKKNFLFIIFNGNIYTHFRVKSL